MSKILITETKMEITECCKCPRFDNCFWTDGRQTGIPEECPLEDKSEGRKWFAEVRWSVLDIKSVKPEWTEEECRKWLLENEKCLRDRMVEFGWEVIETMTS